MAPSVAPIFFLHLPKTGGSSIRALLRNATGGNAVERDFLFAREVTGSLSASTSIIGHLKFMPTEWPAIRERFATLTVLRNPAERLISQYFQYRRSDPSQRGPVERDGRLLSLMEFLEECASGATKQSNALYAPWLASLAWDGAGRLDDGRMDALALEALATFDMVGVTEDLDQVLKQLSIWLPELPHKMPYVNVTSDEDRREISVEALRLAAAITERDVFLHEEAKRLAKRKHRRRALADPRTCAACLPTLDFGAKRAEIVEVSMHGVGVDLLDGAVDCGQEFEIRVKVRAHEDIDDLTIGMSLADPCDRIVFGTNSVLLGHRLAFRAGSDTEHVFRVYADIGPGSYSISVTLHRGLTHFEGCEHWLSHATAIIVRHARRLPGFVGIAFIGVTLKSAEVSVD